MNTRIQMEERLPAPQSLPTPPKSFPFPTNVASTGKVPSLYHMTVQQLVKNYGPPILQDIHMSHTPQPNEPLASFDSEKGGMPFTGVSGQTWAGRASKPAPKIQIPLNDFFNQQPLRPSVYKLMQQHIGTPRTIQNLSHSQLTTDRIDNFHQALQTLNLGNDMHTNAIRQAHLYLQQLKYLLPPKPIPHYHSQRDRQPRGFLADLQQYGDSYDVNRPVINPRDNLEPIRDAQGQRRPLGRRIAPEPINDDRPNQQRRRLA